MIRSTYHLYHTDRLNSLYHDCLHYEVQDDSLDISYYEGFKHAIQIIPYCIRPYDESENESLDVIFVPSISSNTTFEELRKKQVSSNDLYSWSTSVDLSERYQRCLDKPDSACQSQIFYNCTHPWFGSYCQYTFNSVLSFGEIAKSTFFSKTTSKDDSRQPTDFNNLTCYIHLKCNRGGPHICLDWREVCDENIDCVDGGADEMYCFQLEANQCAPDEYQCRNGMCIPESFLHDDPYNPECLDSTDERNAKYSDVCYRDPAFRCEEFTCRDVTEFVCGDGQCVYKSMKPFEWKCVNHRGTAFINWLLSYEENRGLSYDCWLRVTCLLLPWPWKNSTIGCKELCTGGSYRCQNDANKLCQSAFFIPFHPLLQGHVRFAYCTNSCSALEILLTEDYICYDDQMCSFSPISAPTLLIDGISCRHRYYLDGWSELGNRIFYTCATLDPSGNKTHCRDESLFHCPGTSKCISKRRLLDGVIDCYSGIDERFSDTCTLNDKHRFACQSEKKCLSPVLLLDGDNDCDGGEDEIYLVPENELTWLYYIICNRYPHLKPERALFETDETTCEHWPCNNPYTRCDGAWTCLDGADELNCPSSQCPTNHHECILPDKKLTCLHINRTNDGIMDCLGGTDELHYCQAQLPTGESTFHCWNSSRCNIIELASICPFRDLNEQHLKNPNIMRVLLAASNENLEYPSRIHFLLYHSNVYPLTILIEDVESEYNHSVLPSSIGHHNVDGNSDSELRETKIDLYYAWLCNRGIVVFYGLHKNERCLCPPSYYGNRCQYQNQRVSLTVQFRPIDLLELRTVFNIIVILLDHEYVIHSHEQFKYIPAHHCEMKYNIYLLYENRVKDITKNYTVHIDAYKSIDLTHFASWQLPVKFAFLPVNRLAAQLTMPSIRSKILRNCSMDCKHGACVKYENTGEFFCRCDPNWSGLHCTTFNPYICRCSNDSICIGWQNNRSICVCPLKKFGSYCHLNSVCRREPCKNDGVCVSKDERISTNDFICLCKDGFSGVTCEKIDTKIEISFKDLPIPQSILAHYIQVNDNANPIRTTTFDKVSFSQETAILYRSTPFHLLFVQIQNFYYIAVLQEIYRPSRQIFSQLTPSRRCPSIEELFRTNEELNHPLLRRIKFYHTFCVEQTELECFYDSEAFICLCNRDRYANCFYFNFTMIYSCSGWKKCYNGASCFQTHPICPTKSMCVCTECFYGNLCQFTTKGFGISLEAMIGYHIHPYVAISRQPVVVKVSMVLTIIILVMGLTSSILTMITFQNKNAREVGCGLYLFTLSIVNCLSMIIFALKVSILLLSQMSIISNRTFLNMNCVSMEFTLRVLLTIVDWLNACVAIERVVTVIKGIHFDKILSKKGARLVIGIVFLITISSMIHDPIHRHLTYDEEDKRVWCLARYSATLEVFNSIVNILHFILPFSINIISAIVIIVTVTRQGLTVRQGQSYKQYLRTKFNEHKHLLISPLALVLLALPRLIISFMSNCHKSTHVPWLFMASYFISFIPSLLTFVVFILPSQMYKKIFEKSIKRGHRVIQ